MDSFLQIVILIFSVIIHEVAHGLSAYWLGDSTAKYAGRLTLNPLSHLDLWGSFLIPLMLVFSGSGIVFGWAKPVPYNPYNLKNQKWGPVIVGMAGPFSNIFLALIAGVALRALLVFGVDESLFIFPFLATFAVINVLLLVFNLLPIPPLDGSKLLFAFLPISEHTKVSLEQYGFIFLFIFLFMFSGIFHFILGVVLNFYSNWIVGVQVSTFL